MQIFDSASLQQVKIVKLSTSSKDNELKNSLNEKFCTVPNNSNIKIIKLSKMQGSPDLNSALVLLEFELSDFDTKSDITCPSGATLSMSLAQISKLKVLENKIEEELSLKLAQAEFNQNEMNRLAKEREQRAIASKKEYEKQKKMAQKLRLQERTSIAYEKDGDDDDRQEQ